MDINETDLDEAMDSLLKDLNNHYSMSSSEFKAKCQTLINLKEAYER